MRRWPPVTVLLNTQWRTLKHAASARAIAVLACIGALLGTSAAHAEPTPSVTAPTPCMLQPGGLHTVARIIDAETVALDDGREVRLIGALAPRAQDVGATSGAWPSETDAVRVLTTLILGRTVKLAYGSRRTDRYGRHLAHLFLGPSDNEIWVQGELLSKGAARAYGLPGNFECGSELLANERIARTQRRGLWATSAYRPKPARLAGLLMSRRGRYEIVEGPVVDISATKSGTYLNFGTDWKTDFTARIAKDVLSAHPEWALRLADLKGKTVAVRGWIERRNGPMIDIRDMSQLEILDRANQPPALSQKTTPTPTENASTPPADNDPLADTEIETEKRPTDPVVDQPGAVDL